MDTEKLRQIVEELSSLMNSIREHHERIKKLFIEACKPEELIECLKEINKIAMEYEDEALKRAIQEAIEKIKETTTLMETIFQNKIKNK